MQTFDEAVESAKRAKADIARIEAERAAERAAIDAKRRALIDAEGYYNEKMDVLDPALAEARSALQRALQRINDAPIEEQADVLPFDAGNPETYPNQGAPIGAGTLAEDVGKAAEECAEHKGSCEGDYPGFEPLSEEAGRAATGFAY